jgi:hypothetical protein
VRPAGTLATARPGQCAGKPPARIGFNPWPAARAELAPAGARAIRLCRYSPVPSRLVKSVLIARLATVRSLVRQFDRLPPFAGTFNCPVDDGSQIVALLAYPRGHRVAIEVRLRGCNAVSNGDLTRTALGRPGQPGPALLARLKRLTA